MSKNLYYGAWPCASFLLFGPFLGCEVPVWGIRKPGGNPLPLVGVGGRHSGFRLLPSAKLTFNIWNPFRTTLKFLKLVTREYSLYRGWIYVPHLPQMHWLLSFRVLATFWGGWLAFPAVHSVQSDPMAFGQLRLMTFLLQLVLKLSLAFSTTKALVAMNLALQQAMRFTSVSYPQYSSPMYSVYVQVFL